ncbi:MAG: DNA-binding response regulator [Candidatus Cloacimonetes bacterium HGW-Cloacimonetes-1]|jgi:DNA-binding NtrC family response regulator|nr:MAG: DNA-binding response regulator [Candidatus Cloacimonetes bacterium HGW-Cloacimonetes-1]
MELKVLILDDEQRISEELRDFCTRKGFIAKTADRPSLAFTMLENEDFDVLILDVKLPEMDGLQVLEIVKTKHPDLEIIVISGHGDIDTVIQALRSGAIDYLKKPFRLNDLMIAIERTTKFVHLRQNIKALKTDNSLISAELERSIEKNFIGESPAIRTILQDAIQVAAFADTSVIINGESGTGKEIIARIIHYASPRKARKFCPVNCAAIPDNLLESEFFGYKKGTFTGALSDKKGYLELSEGGTLFLDEISDMPANLQSKLLRAIEEKSYMKLGTGTENKVDLRFLSATNQDLEALVASGGFRNDLYYRLAAFKITIPPLRERKEDIEPLILYFARYFCQRNGLPIPAIDKSLVDELWHYDFPGNVRELKNLVERALIINRSGKLGINDFPVYNAPGSNANQGLIQNQVEQLKAALKASHNNQSKAAESLGISRFALIRLMKKYDI